MIRFTSIILASLFLIACSSNSKIVSELESSLQNGDIIFQSSHSKQCEAVKLATHSEYSHVGIIFEDEGKWMVYEAVQPVKKTPLKDWIKHGEDGQYVVKRLKNAKKVLTKQILEKMQTLGETLLGKNYDIYFNWSNDEIYCSELVWKIYDEAAGIHIGELKELKDFDLTSQAVREIMAERYGNSIPLEEKVIAPSDLFDSKKLVLVDQQ